MANGPDPQYSDPLPPSGGLPPDELPPPADPNAKNWCVAAHLSALVGLLGLGFGHLLGPLVVWLLKKGESPVIGEHARAALNFQITMTIAGLICVPLMFVLIGGPLLVIVAVFDVVNVILAAMAASEGRLRPYPYSLKLIS